MSEYDIYWYLLGLSIMTAIFVCGYRIGNRIGWQQGLNDASTLFYQRQQGIWRRLQQPVNGEKPWEYRPKEKRLSATQ